MAYISSSFRRLYPARAYTTLAVLVTLWFFSLCFIICTTFQTTFLAIYWHSQLATSNEKNCKKCRNTRRYNWLTHRSIYNMFCQITILSKPNVTQLNSTQLKQLKSNFVGLDIVLTWNPPTPPHPHHTTPPQTFQALLDQLESWNLAHKLTKLTWLR